MSNRYRFHASLLAVAALAAAPAFTQEDPGAPVPPPDLKPDEVFNLWPEEAPGETGDVGPEIMLVERRRPFYQITNVTTPTVSVYLPKENKATGAAVMVFPGGGLVRLAIEHEGYEIAEWLRDNGVAAFLVKYRVPPRGEDRRKRWQAGVQDAQRAISLVRSRADQFGIDPDGIGAIGFSAGGEIGTWLSISDERYYDAIDNADRQPTRPAFMLNIYPGGLAYGLPGGEPKVRDDMLALLDEKTPPMFFAHAFPDASMNSILTLAELKKKNIPAELHIFQQGAHGFGARRSSAPFAAWTDLAMAWMRSLGFLDRSHVRRYPVELTDALKSGSVELPLIPAIESKTTFPEAYAAQKRLVARAYGSEEITGFKGAASSTAAQKSLKISAPYHCALFASGKQDKADWNSLSVDAPSVVETEIGYIMGVDIATHIEDAGEARTATQAVVAVVEIPSDMAKRTNGKNQVADAIASNCGGETKLLIGPERHPDKIDLAKQPVSLARGGTELYGVDTAVTKGGQWENLKVLINQIVDEGRIIREGDLIMSGAIGAPQAAESGAYTADYGDLGKLEFRLR